MTSAVDPDVHALADLPEDAARALQNPDVYLTIDDLAVRTLRAWLNTPDAALGSNAEAPGLLWSNVESTTTPSAA